MKIFNALLVSTLPALFLTGCDSLSHTENGALAGGAIGAGTGAIIGNALGHTGGGAAIGAGIGALSGGLIGNSADKTEARAVAAAQARTLGLTDVAQMAQQHISDDVIIGQVRSTGSVYNLSPNDIYWLKQQGVSDCVIREMQNARGRRAYSVSPVYPQPVYVYEPPPPVSVGFGFGYGRGYGRGCRW